MFVLVGFALFFAGPIVWLLLAPTKSSYEVVFRSSFAFGSFHNIIATWRQLDSLNDHIYRRWLENSLFYTFSATGLTLISGVPAGYGLAIGRFRGRKLLLALTLVGMIMPTTALVLPIFLELFALHLIDSPLAVILPFAFFPFGVYLTYIYYVTALPSELVDAARLDGCNEWQVFRRVALPLARPVVALVLFFSFVADWSNFFLPYIVLPDESRFPVQVGLNDILLTAPRPQLALATLIAVAPVAVIFVLVQPSLARGFLTGSRRG
jgi:multiple sugar transport system permease protein